MHRIQAIVINWKRPDNVVVIVHALRMQTIPCRLILCDNHPSDEFALPASTLEKVDDVFRWKTNLGPPSRFTPALVMHDCEYTYFHDDDIIPGHRALEHFLRHADTLKNFATLGQRGRQCSASPPAEGRRRIPRNSGYTAVDTTINLHFVRTEFMHHVLDFKWRLLRRFGDAVPVFEDDLLLNFGIQHGTGFRSYLTPEGQSKHELARKRTLPSPYAMKHRSHHVADRTRLVAMAIECGWHPLEQQGLIDTTIQLSEEGTPHAVAH